MTINLDEFLTTIDRYDGEETKITKPFVVYTFINTKDGAFNTLEEARANVEKRIKDSPFDTSPYYVLEVKEITRAFPASEVQIQTVQLETALKELESKDV
tara:strand:- start:7436 stop:7735 length:300 start_codon:yes stop_codon:yes gene_type:complete